MSNAWKNKTQLENLRSNLEQETLRNRVNSQFDKSKQQSPSSPSKVKQAPTKKAPKVFIRKAITCERPKHNAPRRCHIPTCRPNLKHDRNRFKWVAPGHSENVGAKEAKPSEPESGADIVKELLDFDKLLEPTEKNPFSELGGCFNADDDVDRRSTDRSSSENMFAVHDSEESLEIKEENWEEELQSPDETPSVKEDEDESTKVRGKVVDCVINDHRHEEDLISSGSSEQKAKKTTSIIEENWEEELSSTPREEDNKTDKVSRSETIEIGNGNHRYENNVESQHDISSNSNKEDYKFCGKQDVNLQINSKTSPIKVNQQEESKVSQNEDNVSQHAEESEDKNVPPLRHRRNDSFSSGSYRGDSFDEESYTDESYTDDDRSWSDETSRSDSHSPSSKSYEASLSSGTEESTLDRRRRQMTDSELSESELSKLEMRKQKKKPLLTCGKNTNCCGTMNNHKSSQAEKPCTTKQTNMNKTVLKSSHQRQTPYERPPRTEKIIYKPTQLYNWKTNKVETIRYNTRGQHIATQESNRKKTFINPVQIIFKQQQSPDSSPSKKKKGKKAKKNERNGVQRPPMLVQALNFPPLMKAVEKCSASSVNETQPAKKDSSVQLAKKESSVQPPKRKILLPTPASNVGVGKITSSSNVGVGKIIPKLDVPSQPSRTVLKKSPRPVKKPDPRKMTMEDVMTNLQTTDHDMEREVKRVNEEIRENVIQLAPIIENEPLDLSSVNSKPRGSFNETNFETERFISSQPKPPKSPERLTPSPPIETPKTPEQNFKGMTRMEKIMQALASPAPVIDPPKENGTPKKKNPIYKKPKDEGPDDDWPKLPNVSTMNTVEKIALWEARNKMAKPVDVVNIPSKTEEKQDENPLKACNGHHNLLPLTNSTEQKNMNSPATITTPSTTTTTTTAATVKEEKEKVEAEVPQARVTKIELSEETEANLMGILNESFHENSFMEHQNEMVRIRQEQDLKENKYEIDVSKDIMMMQTLTIQGAPKEVSEKIDQSYGVFKSHWSPYEDDKMFWNGYTYQTQLDHEILILNEKPLPESLTYEKLCNKDCYFDVGKKLHLQSPEAVRAAQ